MHLCCSLYRTWKHDKGKCLPQCGYTLHRLPVTLGDAASTAAAGEGAGGGSVRGLDGVVAVERSPMLHARRMAKM
jgi:hypothetical protein